MLHAVLGSSLCTIYGLHLMVLLFLLGSFFKCTSELERLFVKYAGFKIIERIMTCISYVKLTLDKIIIIILCCGSCLENMI